MLTGIVQLVQANTNFQARRLISSVGQLYLLSYNSKIFRVLVLTVGRREATCHFLDSGKCQNVALNEALFIPAPGNPNWANTIKQVRFKLVPFTIL